jgi:hypothetical protein
MALAKWLIILVLVALALWLATAPKARGSCPLAGTGGCQCGQAVVPVDRIRADELMSRS